MIQYMLFILLMINSLSFIKMNHPLSMGLLLMIQTILISLFTGLYTYTFWFSYSLFLIFMGGMLILFMYMTSLASNETFSFNLNPKFKMFLFLIFSIIIISIMFIDFKTLNLEMKKINEEKNSIFIFNLLTEKNKMMLNKMYNFPMNMITIMLVFYLFLTLITSVKITNIFKGPLRMK